MTKKRVRPVLNLASVLEEAFASAQRAGVAFRHQTVETPGATTLKLEAMEPGCASISVTDAGPGIASLDVGVGLRGEWILRSDDQARAAVADFGQIFEAIFRGDVEESVRLLPFGRELVRGVVRTPQKTYRFMHATLSRSGLKGTLRYKPYPSVSDGIEEPIRH